MDEKIISIRGDITASIHPAVVDEAHAQVLTRAGRTLAKNCHAAAREALEVAYVAIGNLNDTVTKFRSPTKTTRRKGQRMAALEDTHDLSKAVDAALKRSITIIDRRTREINAARAKLVEAIDVALAPPSRDHLAGNMASEIRAHFAELKGSERLRLGYAAMESGDRTTLAALLHAPAYLSGMDDTEQAELRRLAAKALAPDEAAEVEEIDRLMERVRLAGSTLTSRYGEILEQLPGEGPRKEAVRTLARQ